MNKYRVTVELECTYEVDAPNKETAMDIAYEWFLEAIPDFTIEEIVEDDENE